MQQNSQRKRNRGGSSGNRKVIVIIYKAVSSFATRYATFVEKTFSHMKKHRFEYAALNVMLQEYGANVDDMVCFAEPRVEQRKRVLHGEEVEVWEETFLAYNKENKYVLWMMTNGQMAKGGESISYWTYPCIYIIKHKENGMVFYIGLAQNPLNRYCDHFGKNNYGHSRYNTSTFYTYIRMNQDKFSFDEFTMEFIPVDIFYDEDINKWVEFCSYRHALPKRTKEALDIYTGSDEYDQTIEQAEAVVMKVIMEMDEDGIITVYRKEDGKPIFLQDEKHEEDMNERCVAYEKKYGKKNPIKTCLKRAALLSYDVNKLAATLRIRETKALANNKAAFDFAVKVWGRQDDILYGETS